MKCPVCGADGCEKRADGMFFCKACYSIFTDDKPAEQKGDVGSYTPYQPAQELLAKYGAGQRKAKPVERLTAEEAKKRGYRLEGDDPAEAFRCFKEGAEKGDVECMYKVAYAYENGRGVDANSERAWFWYSEGRRAGDDRCARVLRERFGGAVHQNVGGGTADGSVFSDLFMRLLPSVVRIYADFRGEDSCGTGFIVAGGYVVTNAHVVLNKTEKGSVHANKYSCNFSPKISSATYQLEPVCTDEKQDIAIMRCTSSNDFGRRALDIGDSDAIVPGQDAFTIGNGRNYGLAFTRLSVSQSPVPGNRFGDYDEIIQLTGNTQPGNSGGPLFNIDGEVVGIITFHPVNQNYVYGAVPTPDGQMTVTKQVVETAVDGVRFALTVKTLRKVAAKANIIL